VVGNLCTSSDGVMGSVEYALTGDAPPPLLLVLGNSSNAVVTDAVRKAMTEAGRAAELPETRKSWLSFSAAAPGGETDGAALIDEMMPAARDAMIQEPRASFDRLCELAGKLNVWRTVETLVSQSGVVFDKINAGELQVQGAYFDVSTGKVAVMGQHPSLSKLLTIPPKVDLVRTASAAAVPFEEAFAACYSGNARYAGGHGGSLKVDDEDLLVQLSEGGQNPVSIVLGCADSRAPIELLFDMKPGDLFVLRNAGNTCASEKGSVIGSAEYSVANLKTKCILVLGHTKCGAVVAATQTVLGGATKNADGTYDVSSLDLDAVPGSIGNVLRDIVDMAAKAIEQKPDAPLADQVLLATDLNVTYTMEKILRFSEIIRNGVLAGDVGIYGAVYDIFTGKVEWLGQHPELEAIVGQSLPVHSWKTSPYISPAKSPTPRSAAASEALKKLSEGNTRFMTNTTSVSGGFEDNHASASDICDQDPFAIVVGGSEASVPLEKIFDATPGSLVVQRSMCNIAGRAGGTLFASLEYAVQKWNPKVLVVMGESHSSVIQDAFKQIAGDKPPSTAQSSILSRVMVSALRAQQQVTDQPSGTSAGRDNMMRQLAVELNALYTIEQLLTSPIISKAVQDGSLEIHAAVLDCTTGKVEFVGEHPMQTELMA